MWGRVDGMIGWLRTEGFWAGMLWDSREFTKPLQVPYSITARADVFLSLLETS